MEQPVVLDKVTSDDGKLSYWPVATIRDLNEADERIRVIDELKAIILGGPRPLDRDDVVFLRRLDEEMDELIRSLEEE
jgi:hypothetical protein